MPTLNPPADDGFTFEIGSKPQPKTSFILEEQFLTPVTNQLQKFDTPASKGTSPLKISVPTRETPREQKITQNSNSTTITTTALKSSGLSSDSNSASTPKDRQDFNYILDQLSPMPGSWVVKQNETFEDNQNQRLNNNDEDKFGNFLSSTQSSPESTINRDISLSSLKGELEDEERDRVLNTVSNDSQVEQKSTDPLNFGPVSSSRPNIPSETNGKPLSALNKISKFGSLLTDSFGLSGNHNVPGNVKTEDSDVLDGDSSLVDNSAATILTTELSSSKELQDQPLKSEPNSNGDNGSSDDSSVSESGFIDLDSEQYISQSSSKVQDSEKTPVVPLVQAFQDQDKTPTLEDSKRFTNPLNSNDFRLSSSRYSRTASPLIEEPIYEEEEAEDQDQEEPIARSASILDRSQNGEFKFRTNNLVKNALKLNISASSPTASSPSRFSAPSSPLVKDPASPLSITTEQLSESLNKLNMSSSSPIKTATTITTYKTEEENDHMKHQSIASSIYSERDSVAYNPATSTAQLTSIPESHSFEVDYDNDDDSLYTPVGYTPSKNATTLSNNTNGFIFNKSNTGSSYNTASSLRAPLAPIRNHLVSPAILSDNYIMPEREVSPTAPVSNTIQINEDEEEIPALMTTNILNQVTYVVAEEEELAPVTEDEPKSISPVGSKFTAIPTINAHASYASSVYTNPLDSPADMRFPGSINAYSTALDREVVDNKSPNGATGSGAESASVPDSSALRTGKIVQSILTKPQSNQPGTSSTSPTDLKLASNGPTSPTDSKKPRVSVRQTSLYQTIGDRNQSVSTIQSKANPFVPNTDSSLANSKLQSSTNTMDELVANSESSKNIFDMNTAADAALFGYENDEDDTSALFVTATYPFDSTTLDSENDAAICLSFNQNDIAFTYSLDDSGWGEVTLINTLKRGWVPMNYFRATLVNDIDEEFGDLPIDKDSNAKKLKGNSKIAASKKPLKRLFKSAGTFLLNPQNKPVYIKGELKGYTFDINCINGITLGIRLLLKETDCISRTSEIVQKKPIIRKLRKKLLRDWSDLIFKAKDYLHTVDVTKIEYLQLMTYQVLQKSITFLDVWGLESDDLEEKAKKKLIIGSASHLAPIVYLQQPPIASYRISEIYNYLIGYLVLMSGRLDLVEHNIQGCQVLENVTNQVNLLVAELHYIGFLAKTLVPSDYKAPINLRGGAPQHASLPEQFKTLDSNSSKLESLRVALNENIKVLVDVANRRNISNNIKAGGSIKRNDFNSPKLGRNGTTKSSTRRPNQQGQPFSDMYFYSKEGGGVISSACKMVGLVTSSYKIIKNLVGITKDFDFSSSRKYPDFQRMNISPQLFIKKCSFGLITDKRVNNQVKQHKQVTAGITSVTEESDSNSALANSNRASKRFSMFRAGDSGDMELTSDGLDFLSEIAPKDSSPFISSDSTFEQFLDDGGINDNSGGNPANNLVGLGLSSSIPASIDAFNQEDEIIRGQNNELMGSSFRSLVALLTDELSPPDYFFTSTFFLTFRIFSHGSILLEELVARFDVNDTILENEKRNVTGRNMFSSLESKMKSRRKLVCKTFQLWLESYWKPRNDYILLAPLLNFFNEAVREFLPIEAFRLLEMASKLVGQPPVETIKDRLNYYNNIDNDSQLIPRKISPKLQKKHISKHLSTFSFSGLNGLTNEIDAYNSFLDDIDTYDLEKVETRNSIATSRQSLNMGLSIDLKNSGSNSLLLNEKHIETIERVNLSYRNMLQDHWIRGQSIQSDTFVPMDTQSLIESWWKTSQETWKILNQDLALLNFNGLEIAKQLTLIENKMFCSIKAEELLNQNFTSKKLHLNLSPNIQRSVLFTNLLSDYVIESILQPNLTIKQRVHAVKCWLKVAISCLYLRNFNSLASIMTSLQSFLISRISKIWDSLSEKYKDLFQYLSSIIHPEKNYLVYRNKLKDFLTSNLEEDLDIPIVPYLSLFLQDLTFIVDGNPNYRTNSKSFLNQKLINIDKYFKITKIIADLQTLQIPYKDIGELGSIYNDDGKIELIRSATIKNLKNQLSYQDRDNTDFVDMFDITGIPCLQELIMLEIWKVKQVNVSEDDRSWKLSCDIQPRDE